jgi:hypothetical protein
MGRIARLEQRVDQLEKLLAGLTFDSQTDTIQVMVPVTGLDPSGNPNGTIITGYRTIKLGPTSGELRNGTIVVK